MKRWRYRPYDPSAADLIAARSKLPRLLAVLLAQRGVESPEAVDEFLEPKLDQLLDPFLMKGMSAAVERIRQAVDDNQKILVYGDYDVDGTTATVLLRAAISLAGGSADFHTPHRVKEGYGMRAEVVEQAAADNVKLLISVDTGIREAEVVAGARKLGIDVIITDHHLPDEGALPDCIAVLNPNQPGCEYPEKNLSGVGVAFKLADALFRSLEFPPGRREKILRSMLKMAAVGTVADLVPLTGENRVLARLGLEELSRPTNPGLIALLDVAGLTGKPVSAGDVGFRIGPRINAAGRMDTARNVIELFSTQDKSRAHEIAKRLDELNSERRQAEADVVDEIIASFGDRPPPPDVIPFFVVQGERWHPGVIGIVASRIVERLHRPTLVLSVDPDTGLAVGSGRSIPAFHLLESMESVHDIFERFGGHKQAAGCTIRTERISELRTALNEYALNILGPEDFIPELKLDVELPFVDIDDAWMQSLGRLAPFGMGNPTPVFSACGVEVVGEPRIIKEKHLKINLRQGDRTIQAMAWRMAELEPLARPGAVVDVAFTVDWDDYIHAWRLTLKDLRTAT